MLSSILQPERSISAERQRAEESHVHVHTLPTLRENTPHKHVHTNVWLQMRENSAGLGIWCVVSPSLVPKWVEEFLNVYYYIMNYHYESYY